MRLFDTHAHLDDERFDEDRDELVASFPGAGVALVLAAAADAESSARGIALAEKYPHVLAAIGVHPHVAKDIPDEEMKRFDAWSRHPRVVAVGEIGLDYHYDFRPRDVQMRCFLQQLELARRSGLPAQYHLREAWGDFLPMARRGDIPFGVMHCFSGSVESARECLDAGLYISLAGPVTFKNARNLHEVARYVPLDRLVVETDSPDLSPEPLRGRRNDPRNVKYTAAAIAELRGIKEEEFFEAAFQNACRLFSVDENGVKSPLSPAPSHRCDAT
jgi:TatD DNase family protein